MILRDLPAVFAFFYARWVRWSWKKPLVVPQAALPFPPEPIRPISCRY